MKNQWLAACAASILLCSGCDTTSVVEPQSAVPVKADTARNVFAFLTPSTAMSASDVYAAVTLPSVKTYSDLRADSTAPAFTYFSLKTGNVVADSVSQWDLAFRATTIRVNGQAQLVSGMELEDLAEAPEGGYTAGIVPSWYDYAGAPSHLVTPKPATVIVIKTADGRFAKLQVTSYYKGSPASPDGLKDTARHFSFKYLLQGDTTRSLTAAPNPNPPTYFSLKTGKAIADSAGDWDISFRSTSIKVKGESQILSGSDFEQVEEAPASGWSSASIPAWYDYSGEPNHTITPKPRMVILVKTPEGKYGKVQVTSYYKGAPATPDGLKDAGRYYSFKYLLQADGSRNLDAAENGAPYTYFSLRTGKVVDDSAAQWDLSFRATSIRVNGEAQILDGADFDRLKEAPEGGYSKASLPAWYDYSGAPDHTVTPKLARVIALRTSDGKYAKVQILSYYKDAPKAPVGTRDPARYYTFRHVLQADGSRNLETTTATK